MNIRNYEIWVECPDCKQPYSVYRWQGRPRSETYPCTHCGRDTARLVRVERLHRAKVFWSRSELLYQAEDGNELERLRSEIVAYQETWRRIGDRLTYLAKYHSKIDPEILPDYLEQLDIEADTLGKHLVDVCVQIRSLNRRSG